MKLLQTQKSENTPQLLLSCPLQKMATTSISVFPLNSFSILLFSPIARAEVNYENDVLYRSTLLGHRVFSSRLGLCQ